MSTSVDLFFPKDQKDKMQPFIDAFCLFHNAKRHPEGNELKAHSAQIIDPPREDDEPFVSIPLIGTKKNTLLRQ